MDAPFLVAITGIGLAMICGAGLVGYWLQRGCGIVLLAVGAALASGLCLVAAAFGGRLGLIGAILGVGLLGGLAGYKLGGRRGASLVGLLWLGFAASCVIGFWIGGGIGLVAVTLPANLLFWATLYVLSGFLLPLEDDSEAKEAFHSLLTFSLGTNYPYLVMRGRELDTRVPGSPYKAFFSGPGIILTGCDHLVVTTDGTHIKDPKGPGLTFTKRFEVVQSVIDLRPQLRAFAVDARTSDGVPIRVLTFVPFRVDWGGEKPRRGKPYPFRKESILRAITNEIVEQDQDEKRNWDDLVEIHATRIMRDIICRYRFDEFCMAVGPLVGGTRDKPHDILQRHGPDEWASPPDRRQEPRYQIRDELVNCLRQQLQPYGIEVMGAGISNLSPVDESVIEQRIKNWRTKWHTRIQLARAEGEAMKTKLVETARIDVEVRLLRDLVRILEGSISQGARMSDELLATALVACLQQMAENANVKDRLSADAKQRLAALQEPHLRGSSGTNSGAGD
jgi:hypothetical protein